MSAHLIIFTGLIYLYIAAEQLHKGNGAMAMTYFGYAFANVGLYIMAAKWKRTTAKVVYTLIEDELIPSTRAGVATTAIL